MKYNFFLLLFIFCASCADNNFPRVEVINKFRVLGIVADEPEVIGDGTGTTNVYPYVTDPKGNGRTINGTYEVCIDPGVSFGATPDCKKVPGAVFGNYSINFTADSDFAANGYTGKAATAVAVTVPSSIYTGRSSRQQFNGVAMLVIFRFIVDGNEVSAFRRIIATNRGSFNDNPATPMNTLLNGVPLNIRPSKNDTLSLAPLNDEETYDYQTVDGLVESRTESYEVSWYVSGGELSKAKTGMSESTKLIESVSGNGSFVSVVMIRDDRGGLSVRREFIP